ncbi:hypothetical protein F5146DRAFT_970913 [Armillaria mellea]|nr:hypothetical protein F5146DRAFT_970913 [Armillaria mellea]
MAHRRPSPQTVNSSSASSPPLARKKYPLRPSPSSRRRNNHLHFDPSVGHRPLRGSTSSTESRPVLVPLQPNLRRLPSRVFTNQKGDLEMHIGRQTDPCVGSKRKRVAGSNENAQNSGRPTRGSGVLKRLRSSYERRREFTSDESDASSMDIDGAAPWSISRNSDSESGEEEQNSEVDEESEESTDDHLINSAPPNQLLRLRKDELVRLYALTGLSEDAEQLTKSDIVDAIITARDDVASLPPSSPPGHGNSSDYSSDEGNVAENERDDARGISYIPIGNLRRRATTNDLGKSRGRPLKGRSLSMGTFHGDVAVNSAASHTYRRNSRKGSGGSSGSNPTRRRTTSTRSSPLASTSSSVQTPPVTRLRSRKVSAEVAPHASASIPAPVRTQRSSKGKGKQVEFDAQPAQPLKSHTSLDEESDLTELEELEAGLSTRPEPSPRRLRSRDKERERGKDAGAVDVRRVTPMRQAKGRIISLKESETEEEEEEEEEEGGEEEDSAIPDISVSDDDAETEEVDELISTASPSPAPSYRRRTPLRRRLRSRPGREGTASDGDDEDENEEEDIDEAEEDADEESGAEEEGEEDAEGEDDDEVTIAVEPRRLRNGKIVGEEEEEEEEEEEDMDVDSLVEDNEEQDIDVEDIDIDAESDTDEEEGEEEDSEDGEEEDDDVDLTVATTKTLVRLRRNDLVRLCEVRDLEPVGTKPQLAEALLQWRDKQSISSRSSSGTVRPPSTIKRRRRRPNSSDTVSSPILLRSERVHTDEPRTPQVSQEPELELDLGTLGLEDREIPPDKLQKLEKIGSGGFKDVFIGKFKGKRIAISEFRGQLTAMDIKELKLLGGFDHPNIVRFLGVSVPENTKEVPVMMISELCSNGDLFDYIRNVHPPSLHKVLVMMLDIARGLEYLHLRKPSVIHRDCKSSNILITSKGIAKIADFGLAKVKQSTRSMVRSLVGTVNWQAPELWHAHPKYNHKVDVFSCAMVYWEMLQWHQPAKKFPWEGMNEHAIYEIVGTKRQRPSISGLRKQWCPDVVDLIERMWAHEHEKRPTMSEVVSELEDMVKRW